MIEELKSIMKKGLALEGGAMRGLFTCSIFDVFMEQTIVFDGVAGISAGAVFGCNYKFPQAEECYEVSLWQERWRTIS